VCSLRNMSDTQSAGLHWVTLPAAAAAALAPAHARAASDDAAAAGTVPDQAMTSLTESLIQTSLGLAAAGAPTCSAAAATSPLADVHALRVAHSSAAHACSTSRKRKVTAVSSSAAAPAHAQDAEQSSVASASAGAAEAVAPAKRRSAGARASAESRTQPPLVHMHDSTMDWQAEQYGVLRTRLQQQGFLFIRGALNSSVVASARGAFFQQLLAPLCVAGATSEQPTAIAKRAPRVSWAWDAETGELDGRSNDAARRLGCSSSMRQLYVDEVTRFMRALCGDRDEAAEAATAPAAASASSSASARSFTVLSQCTWMRALRQSASTQEHSDLMFFLRRTDHLVDYYRSAESHAHAHGSHADSHADAAPAPCSSSKGSKRGGSRQQQQQLCARGCGRAVSAASLQKWLSDSDLRAHTYRMHCDECVEDELPFYTCWMPLMDLSAASSRLRVLPYSHVRVGGYARMLDVGNGDELPGDYDAAAVPAADWRTAPPDMRAGDLILFDWKLIHAASPHTDTCLRVSMDTRVAVHQWRSEHHQQQQEEEEDDEPQQQQQSRSLHSSCGDIDVLGDLGDGPLPLTPHSDTDWRSIEHPVRNAHVR